MVGYTSVANVREKDQQNKREHTDTHTSGPGLLSLQGLSIDIMICILYKLYILSSYPNPTHHRNLHSFSAKKAK